MTQEALKKIYQLLLTEPHAPTVCVKLEAIAREALAQPVPQPTDIAELVEGMEVSIDVSTGEHDSGNRLFGTVTLAQENQGSKHGLILLVQDPQLNFKSAPLPVQPVRPWVGLTDEERNEIWKKEVGWGDLSYDDEYLMKAVEQALKEKNT